MKTFFSLIGVLIGVLVLSFAMNGLGLVNLKFWGVKYENARTEIFQESKAYKHGTIRDVNNLCNEALKLDAGSHRDALKATIKHRIAAFDQAQLPPHVQKCLNQI